MDDNPQHQHGADPTWQSRMPAPTGPPPGGPQPAAPGFGYPGPPPVGGPPVQPVAPGFGPPAGPRFGGGGFPVARIAAIAVAVAGLLSLAASLLPLYTITVVPSSAQLGGDDAPSGEIRVGIGFYDVFPVVTPPIVAQAIPVLLVLAALCAVPVIVGRESTTAPLASVFAGTGTLLALVLIISSPLPSVELTGELLTEFQQQTGARSVDSLIASVGSVGPGSGLIVALVCALLGWGASLVVVFKRAPAQPAALPMGPFAPFAPGPFESGPPPFAPGPPPPGPPPPGPQPPPGPPAPPQW
ncbi:hypothetical protein H7J07_08405 [Mycobacterium koreense]|uniref:hypothetical protein n=1 Tax=Mycolicibacillus koreensis TaxID=1069220 RepID=UPI000848D9EE|nr:hypothetical protein [Mycolicibacillus koreensis]MCV7248239.1 hypothetical protein [Mycolicibacillus koreensis]ODR09461.1 hypothetical protein BHQ15_06665 [Mycolicibacillus koreensis]BBY55177.1 hypothetical protein MKOR_24280 [Mycolicibacillus koreensis]